MRDPYDVLGLQRGASYEEVKAAFKRLSMQRHPDRGGSHEAMVELNVAYAYILKQFKDDIAARKGAKSAGTGQGQKSGGEQRGEGSAGDDGRERRDWQDIYADIEDELDRLRRDSAAREEKLRRMRDEAWSSGRKILWAKLTWSEFADFIRHLSRSGLKGIAVLVSAAVGIGGVLLETNVISGLVMLGAGIGLFASVAMKNDKGGMTLPPSSVSQGRCCIIPPTGATAMKTPRADYTLEFKKEAVRLVQGGQRQSEAAASLGISGQTLGNWIKADTAGRLTERKALKAVSDEQMEISRLKAELAKTRMERDILKKATAYFARESR